MPSHEPLPTVQELREAFMGAVRGQRMETGDDRDGSIYDSIAGTSAILWSQQAQRDRDLFRARYFDTADGDDLGDRLLKLTGISRIFDAFGEGSMLVQRPSTAAGLGTFFEGTRILVRGGPNGAENYAVLADTTVSASALTATVPIRATVVGPVGGLAAGTDVNAVFDDPLWDNSWQVVSMQCAPGTLFEKAEDYRARVRAQRLAGRVGFQAAIIDACKRAGASSVAVFPSNFASGDSLVPGEDLGICAVYVADAGFSADQALVNACQAALEDWRVLGADLLVGAMTHSVLSVDATVTLTTDPGLVDLPSLSLILQAATAREFAQSGNGFAYSRDALAGAMARTSNLVQSVAFTSPSGDASVLVAGHFPGSLTRYSLAPADVSLAFVAPA